MARPAKQTMIDSFFLLNRQRETRVDIHSTRLSGKRSSSCIQLGVENASSDINITRVDVHSKALDTNSLFGSVAGDLFVGQKRKRADNLFRLQFRTLPQEEMQQRKRLCTSTTAPTSCTEVKHDESGAHNHNSEQKAPQWLPSRRTVRAKRHAEQASRKSVDCETDSVTENVGEKTKSRRTRVCTRASNAASDATPCSDTTQQRGAPKNASTWKSTLEPLLSCPEYVEALRKAGGAPQKLIQIAEEAGLIQRGASDFLVQSVVEPSGIIPPAATKKRQKPKRGCGLKSEKVLEKVDDAQVSEYISHGYKNILDLLYKLVLRTNCQVLLSISFETQHMVTFAHGYIPFLVQRFCDAVRYRASNTPLYTPDFVTKHSNVFGRDKCIQHQNSQPMVPHPTKMYKRNGRSGIVRANYENISAPDYMHPRDIEKLVPRYARMIRMLQQYMKQNGIVLSVTQLAEVHRIMLGNECMEFAPGMYIRNGLSVPLSKRVVDELVSGHADEFGRSMVQAMCTPVQNEDVMVNMMSWAIAHGFTVYTGRLIETKMHAFFAERRCLDIHDNVATRTRSDPDGWIECVSLFAPVRKTAAVRNNRRHRKAQMGEQENDDSSDTSDSESDSDSEDESEDEYTDESNGDSCVQTPVWCGEDQYATSVVPPLSHATGTRVQHTDAPPMPVHVQGSSNLHEEEETSSADSSPTQNDKSLRAKQTYKRRAKERNAPRYHMPAVSDVVETLETYVEQDRAKAQNAGACDATSGAVVDPCTPPDVLLEQLRLAKNQPQDTENSVTDFISDTELQQHRQLLEGLRPPVFGSHALHKVTNSYSEFVQALSKCKETASETIQKVSPLLKPLVLHRQIQHSGGES